MSAREVAVAGRPIGDAAPVYVIAETASSHEGDPELALAMLRAAAGTGADAVKFQMLRGDALLAPDHHKYDAFQQIQMEPEAWERIFAEGRRLGAVLIAEVFDEASLDLAVRLDAPAFKIHSTDLSNPRMLDRVARTGRPVFVSSGGATHDEVAEALDRLRAGGARDLILLHGFQSFPTRLADSHLRQIPALRARFGCVVGYADHVDAETEMAFVLPAMAVAMGARVIEKHITLDRGKRGRDYFSALNPDEFARLVGLLREADQALGRSDDTLGEAELAYRKLMKKSIVAARALAAGAVLGDEDLAFKRTPVPGLPPTAAAGLVGRRLIRAVAANALVTAEDVE